MSKELEDGEFLPSVADAFGEEESRKVLSFVEDGVSSEVDD